MATRKSKLALRANRRKARPGSLGLLRLDPTRTATLRRAFLDELFRRFARLKGKVVALIAGHDSLGLNPKPHSVDQMTGNRQSAQDSPLTLSWEERNRPVKFHPLLHQRVGNFDPDQHPRDDKGEFTSAGGENESVEDAWTEHHDELQDKHDAETDKITEAREKEDNEIVGRREKEDAVRERQEEKEDGEMEKVRDKEDAVAEKTDSKIDKDEERLTATREREDEKTGDARDKEDAAIEKVREKEDKIVERTRASEDKELEKKADRERAELEEKIKGLPEDEQQEHRDELEQKHADDAEVLDANRNDEDSDREERRNNEDAALTESREQADREKLSQRDAEDKDIENRRQANDQMPVILRRKAEDKALAEQGQRESDEREAARKREDDALGDRRAAEDEERTARHAREFEELERRLAVAKTTGNASYKTTTANTLTDTRNSRWADLPDADKVTAFQDWLEQQFKAEGITGLSGEQMWDKYVRDGFSRGAGRAFDDVNRRALSSAAADPSGARGLYLKGSKDQFLRQAFGQPVAVDKVKLLAGRSFDELEGLTGDMSLKMSRMLTDGLVTGKSPHRIAKDLTDQIDIGRPRAETIARTELSRAHSSGQLLALRQLGVEEVGVMVEFTTAGDPCPDCSALAGTVLKLDEAEGLIPQHPNCRCCWIPANVGEDTTGQIRDKDDIEDAFDDAGIDDDDQPDITEDRPRSVLDGDEEDGEDGEAVPYPIDVDLDDIDEREELAGNVGFCDGMWRPSRNAFCPTGEGGGVDPSCSPGGGSRDDGKPSAYEPGSGEGTLYVTRRGCGRPAPGVNEATRAKHRTYLDRLYPDSRYKDGFPGEADPEINDVTTIARDVLRANTLAERPLVAFWNDDPDAWEATLWNHDHPVLHVRRGKKGVEVEGLNGTKHIPDDAPPGQVAYLIHRISGSKPPAALRERWGPNRRSSSSSSAPVGNPAPHRPDAVENFDPDQPRDDHGRWGSMGQEAKDLPSKEGDYRQVKSPIPYEKTPYPTQGFATGEIGQARNDAWLMKGSKEWPVVHLDPTKLKSSQNWVVPHNLSQIEGRLDDEKPILVIRHNGQDYVEHGNHRAVHALRTGQKVPARVAHFDDEGKIHYDKSPVVE